MGSFSLSEDWRRELSPGEAPALRELESFLDREEAAGETVYPDRGLVFNALNSTPLESVRAVIIGQDPYHGPGQAMGLSFSVPEGLPLPPSLRNVFRELHSDLGCSIPASGDLSGWASQGVLLLNSVLTVRAGEAGSHRGRGWEELTDRVISLVSERRSGLVFILWGRHALEKARLIDRGAHEIITSPHPSPLSARRGFFGSRPFSRANEWLRSQGREPIEWCLSGRSDRGA